MNNDRVVWVEPKSGDFQLLPFEAEFSERSAWVRVGTLAEILGGDRRSSELEEFLKTLSDFISVRQAAEILGVSERRVQAMIKQKCPECGGSSQVGGGDICFRCRGTGQYLPADKLEEGSRGPWMILRDDLALVADRAVGKPRRRAK